MEDLPKIDELGLEKLRQYVQDHPNCVVGELKSEIKQGAVETHCRRHKLDLESIVIGKEVKKISPITVAKYLYILRPDWKP